MSAVLAPIKPSAKIWAVGAINGDVRALISVHEQLEDRLKVGDRLVYLGNYWGDGEGSDVLGAIDELLVFRRKLIARPGVELDDLVYLRGGIEEMINKLQQIQFAPNSPEVFNWMLGHGVAGVVRAYGFAPEQVSSIMGKGAQTISHWTSVFGANLRSRDGHSALLAGLKHAAYTTDGAMIFVHAGLDPSRPLDGQSDTFWWGSSLFDTITDQYFDSHRIVRGASLDHGGINKREFTLSLDGGAGYGGQLIAVALDHNGQVVDQITSGL